MIKVNFIRALLLISVFCSTCFGQGTNNAPNIDDVTALLSKAPIIEGESYYCGDMVRAVNALRHLGKDKSLAVLHRFLEEHDKYSRQHEKILLVCRLLFVNPEGWKRPRLGEAAPSLDEEVGAQFPLFPLAVSNGVPFLLVSGFNSAGFTGDTSDKCVELCKNFQLITEDLSERDYEKAAQDLVKSETFQKLYPNPRIREESGEMIADQAHLASERKTKLKGSTTITIKTSP